MTRGYVKTYKVQTRTSRGSMVFFAIAMIIFLFIIAQYAMYLNPGNHTDLNSLHPLEKIRLLRIHKPASQILKADIQYNSTSQPHNRGDAPENIDVQAHKMQTVTTASTLSFDFARDGEPPLEVSSNLHVFYYAWYGSPPFDKKWLHWDHQVHSPPPSRF